MHPKSQTLLEVHIFMGKKQKSATFQAISNVTGISPKAYFSENTH